MEKIALELRKYQQLIVNQAKDKNTIAYLPTGTGKTLIACCLIRFRLEGLRRARDETGETDWRKVIVFIAPTRALLHQQIEYIKIHAQPIKAGEYSGETVFGSVPSSFSGPAKVEGKRDKPSCDPLSTSVDISEETSAQLIQEWKIRTQENEVIGMTPDSLRKLLESGLLPVSAIDTLILDECHHSVSNSAMARLCDSIFQNNSSSTSRLSSKPLIFGMTASPIQSKNKSNNIEEYILQLENRLHSHFFYPTEELITSLEQHTKKPKMFLFEYSEMLSQYVELEFLHIIERIEKCCKLKEIFSQEEQLKQDLSYSSHYFEKILQSVNVSRETMTIISQKNMYVIKECIGQTIDIVRSCGIYCGLKAFSYFMKSRLFSSHTLEINKDSIVTNSQYQIQPGNIKKELEKSMIDRKVGINKVDENKPSSAAEEGEIIENNSSTDDKKKIPNQSLRSLLSAVPIPEAAPTKHHNLIHKAIYIDHLQVKANDVIKYLKGDSHRFGLLINQSYCVYISYLELLHSLSLFCGKKECEEALNKLKNTLQETIKIVPGESFSPGPSCSTRIDGVEGVVVEDEREIQQSNSVQPEKEESREKDIIEVLKIIISVIEAAVTKTPFNSLIVSDSTVFKYRFLTYFAFFLPGIFQFV
jgi:ERCC4-related helicase